MYDWSEFVVHWIDAIRGHHVTMVIELAGVKIVIGLHGLMMWWVCDGHMLGRGIEGGWIGKMIVTRRRCIVIGMLWNRRWRHRGEIVFRRLLILWNHWNRAWLNCRCGICAVFFSIRSQTTIVNILVASGFSPYTIAINVMIKCDFIVIFQFQSPRCSLHRFRCWLKWRFFCRFNIVCAWRSWSGIWCQSLSKKTQNWFCQVFLFPTHIWIICNDVELLRWKIPIGNVLVRTSEVQKLMEFDCGKICLHS